MKKLNLFAVVLLLAFGLSACTGKNKDQKSEEKTQNDQKIISLNGAITEIVYELEKGNQLIGRDVTSTFPEWVRDSVKDLGHVRSLNLEAVLALKPTLILATSSDMNDEFKKSLTESGVTNKIFEQQFTVEGTKSLIKDVAEFIGGKDVQPMLTKIDEDLAKVETFKVKPKVLFIYARGAGTLMVAGAETPMEQMIQIAGGENAVKGITDFKPLTEEAVVNSNPDVILLFDSGLQSLSGKEGLLKAVPALTQTQAGKNNAIITMDGGLISGFGPRVGEAAYQLNQLLKPYAK